MAGQAWHDEQSAHASASSRLHRLCVPRALALVSSQQLSVPFLSSTYPIQHDELHDLQSLVKILGWLQMQTFMFQL